MCVVLLEIAAYGGDDGSRMRRNVVLLMACWLTAVAAAIPPDSGRLQREQEQQEQYWDGAKPGRYQHDGLMRSHLLRGGGNKHFVTSIFPGTSPPGAIRIGFRGRVGRVKRVTRLFPKKKKCTRKEIGPERFRTILSPTLSRVR